MGLFKKHVFWESKNCIYTIPVPDLKMNKKSLTYLMSHSKQTNLSQTPLNQQWLLHMWNYLMTQSKLSLSPWTGMQPRRTVKVTVPTWLACEMCGHRPMSSWWLWIWTVLCGLDWTKNRYKAQSILNRIQQKTLQASTFDFMLVD